MYYCFLKEDIDGLTQDPLNIQKEYAQHIGALCIGSLEKQAFFNASGREVSISNEEVLLRCSYDNLKAGLHLLEKHGANLMEAESDIEQIESWHTLELTSRQIWEADFPKLLMASSEILRDTDKLFLKSKHK